MPYFKWVGVDIVGATKKGKQPALSEHDLSERLLGNGIALLRSRQIYFPRIFWPVNAHVKGDLFGQKSKLLRAGILLPTAIEIVALQTNNPLVYDAFMQLSRDIQHGVPFGQALKKHDLFYDQMAAVMLTAGYESGNIVQALENVASYFHKKYAFSKKIQSVLAMPLMTLLFFVGISVFIVVCIIPRFADMFSSLQQELPPLTRYMINLSNFVCSSSMLYGIVFCTAASVLLYYYFFVIRKHTWDRLVASIPYIKDIVWQYHMSQAFYAISLLLNSGVSLVTSLTIVAESLTHGVVKSQLIMLHDDVVSGQLLNSAMMSLSVFSPELIALITVGQESGTLGAAFENAALVYNERVQERLKRFIFFLQPIVIIVLGLLVATLICAVYLPIMQLSYSL